jgi:hypothetical protein
MHIKLHADIRFRQCLYPMPVDLGALGSLWSLPWHGKAPAPQTHAVQALGRSPYSWDGGEIRCRDRVQLLPMQTRHSVQSFRA